MFVCNTLRVLVSVGTLFFSGPGSIWGCAQQQLCLPSLIAPDDQVPSTGCWCLLTSSVIACVSWQSAWVAALVLSCVWCPASQGSHKELISSRGPWYSSSKQTTVTAVHSCSFGTSVQRNTCCSVVSMHVGISAYARLLKLHSCSRSVAAMVWWHVGCGAAVKLSHTCKRRLWFRSRHAQGGGHWIALRTFSTRLCGCQHCCTWCSQIA